MAFPGSVVLRFSQNGAKELNCKASLTEKIKLANLEKVYTDPHQGINQDRNEIESLKQKKGVRLGRKQLQQKSASQSAQVAVALG